jgi:hypothetical protein
MQFAYHFSEIFFYVRQRTEHRERKWDNGNQCEKLP